MIPTQDTTSKFTLINTVYMPETQTLFSLSGYHGLDMQVLDQFMSFSLAGNNNSWEYLTSAGPKVDAVLVASYPYVYAYGGCRGFRFVKTVFCSNFSSNIMKYNVITREWTIEDTNVMRTEAEGVLTPKKALYVYGGRNPEDQLVGDLQYLGNTIQNGN